MGFPGILGIDVSLGSSDTVVTDQDSWPPWSIEIDQRPDKKFRQGFLGVPAAAVGEEEQKASSFVHSPRRGELIPYMGWGWECVQRSGWRGDFGDLPAPLVPLCAGVMCSLAVVFCFVFLVSVYLVQNLPQLCIHIVISSLLWFLSILLLEEMFVQAQALQQSSKGSQVPGLFQNELWNSDFEHLIRFLCIGIFSHYGHQKEKPKLNRRQTLPRHEHHCNQDLIIISSSYSRPNKIQLLAEM